MNHDVFRISPAGSVNKLTPEQQLHRLAKPINFFWSAIINSPIGTSAEDAELRAKAGQSRLNGSQVTIKRHLQYCYCDFRAFLLASSKTKAFYALLAMPGVIWLIFWSVLGKLLLPSHMRFWWNYYYDNKVPNFTDARHIRDVGMDLRPLIFGWMTLAPPTALLLIGKRSLEDVTKSAGFDSSDAVKGYECFRLVQNPDKKNSNKELAFFHSPAFPLVALATYAIGIPAAISTWIFFHSNIDAYLGYPSHDPQFKTRFIIVGLYLMSLSWCICAVFFRTYFTYALSYLSSQYEIEFYPDVVKVLPVRGWFLDFVFFRNASHFPHEILWQDVKEVSYFPARLAKQPEELKNPVLNRLWSLSRFFDALINSIGTKSDLLEIKSAQRTVTISLGDLSNEQKAELLLCLRKYLPSIYLDKSVQAGLVGSTVLSEPRYTAIWFDVLTNKSANEQSGKLDPGTELQDGAYKVIEKVGSGGQAVIYRAINKDGEEVILKEYQLIPGESLEVMIESAKSFENESTILGQLSHEQIVKLESMFYKNNCVYLVLEYVEGLSLRQLVSQQGKLDPEEVVLLARQMCRILAYLHGQNPPIIHRDFTPDNLILQSKNELKLIDFSVAQNGQNVKTGDCAGKHAYTPPEQFRGEPCPQSDIYALGATLYYLLTAEDPEPISTSSPRNINPDIPEKLNEIIEHATKLSLAERSESVDWLLVELESITKQLSA